MTFSSRRSANCKVPPHIGGHHFLLGPSLTLSLIHGDRFRPVSKIIGLASSANKVEGPTLKQLMKVRLIKRQNPVYESFDEFIAVRTSCHLVEEVEGEFLCDCRFGVRGKLCCHSMALVYDRKKEFPIDPRLNLLRFKRKRPVHNVYIVQFFFPSTERGRIYRPTSHLSYY